MNDTELTLLTKIHETLEKILKELELGKEMSIQANIENKMEGKKMEGELQGIFQGMLSQAPSSSLREVKHGNK